MDKLERCLQIEKGNDTHVYEFLGCHLDELDGKKGAYFRVFAPNAKDIYLVGDFNNWDRSSSPLHRIDNTNVWETFIEKVKPMQKYKYIVIDNNDKEYIKADPYSHYEQNIENDNDFASYVYDISGYKWHDQQYLDSVRYRNHLDSPMNIYEICLLTWKKHSDGSYFSYKELATRLVSYCKKMGYTHIELLPISEFPFDISWGYQVTGYFATTSRYGTPKDLMYFVDKCHEAGLGVILDWVPGHFEIDEFGLIDWDGAALYESPKWDRKNQLAWGTRIFDYENPYVSQFLVSSALYYMRNFHFDGIRVDAVSSILYLDFCRNPDEWLPSPNGDNINYAGAEFIRRLNGSIFGEFPNAIMIAEEVTGWPKVTRPIDMGGLGFNFKWNIGWINDIWEYTSMDPHFRKYHHNIITHSIDYCFDENHILPVNHDEVGNGRHSLIHKMNGDMKTKHDLCRAFYVYMFMHPGKKLSFMGCEFGQIVEWHYKNPLNFQLLKADRHRKLTKFIIALNKLYLNTPEMYQIDFDGSGYEWLVKEDNSHCINAFKRFDHNGNYLICLCNFSPYRYADYVMGVDEPGAYEVIFSSDSSIFGGSGEINETMYTSIMNKNGKTNAIRINVPANTSMIIRKVKKD